MIDEVKPTTRGLSLLPTRGHGAQVHPRHPLASDVPGYPGVVPRGHAAAKVMEVDLALLSCPHLVAFRQVVRLVKNCPGHEPPLGGIASASRNVSSSRRSGGATRAC